jgi:hypothetical protein
VSSVRALDRGEHGTATITRIGKAVDPLVYEDRGGGDHRRGVTALDRPASSWWLELASCKGKPTSW